MTEPCVFVMTGNSPSPSLVTLCSLTATLLNLELQVGEQRETTGSPFVPMEETTKRPVCPPAYGARSRLPILGVFSPLGGGHSLPWVVVKRGESKAGRIFNGQ